MLNDLVNVIRSELQKLPPNQATAFWLGAVEQVPYSEVADQMGLSANHIGVLVHRARDAIKDRLRERDLLAKGPDKSDRWITGLFHSSRLRGRTTDFA